MEFASAIVGVVAQSLMVPVQKHLGYLFLSRERVRNMSARMKILDGTFDDVKNHKDRNDMNTLEIPARVPDWLEEVAKIKSETESISSNEKGCFNIKARYQMGRNAWKTSQKIEPLLQEGLAFSWTDAQKPLGRVYTKRASTSAPSNGGGIGDEFKSRDTTFQDAMKFLEKDQKTRVIALCGMGGVGKTTMMEQLKKAVEDKKMFDWVVKVVIGQQPNTLLIQQAVAENLGHSLTEEIETTRADRLHKRFEETLKISEKGILVILDDVWGKVELKNVGLSPLPNGVKLLVTSRFEDFCRGIAVEGNLDLKVLKVNVLEETEAHKFLCQITGISKEHDLELYQIGGKIIKKCSYLPLAIKLIAPTLQDKKKFIWREILRSLKKNGPNSDVDDIIMISYQHLKEEDKEIFLLCGLFPEDSDIPIEDLTRYAWGLNLLSEVSTFGDARDRTNKCVCNLKNANLLIDSDFSGCVKMHDLVLAFVLAKASKGDPASIIEHGDVSNWSSVEMSESCKRISLTCKGMYEFPKCFKCPNISLLKLMNGEHLLEFPEGENFKNLEVIAYDDMRSPSFPISLHCSTNLRTLIVHDSLFMFDLSSIGNLLNLEVLCFAYCSIKKLPSTIGKLKKLKLLDLTSGSNIDIDDCVLKNLVQLEEFYMRVEGINFTTANMVEWSKNLTALEIAFFHNNAQPKNMSFKKLERFKISLGCSLKRNENKHSFENTLTLVTNKRELLDSRINELFDKTEVLHLQVNGINDLGDDLLDSLHRYRSSFYNLRVLDICNCANLRYLFTVHVANGLTKLEHLSISLCPVLETVVDGNNGGVGVIKFQALKFLSLGQLPKLTSLCNIASVIELPQLEELILDNLPKLINIFPASNSTTSSMLNDNSTMRPFLNKEVVISQLKKLTISKMKRLKEIWPSQYSNSEEVSFAVLRMITVDECDNLVDLFPSNPMSLFHHLEVLEVMRCGSIEVLFNINLGCFGKIEEVSTCLRSIKVSDLGKLRQVWRIKGANNSPLLISGFQALESLEIKKCKRFRNVFTPTTTTNFDMRALTKVTISDCGMVKRSQEQQVDVMSNEDISEVDGIVPNVVFSSNLIRSFHHVHALHLINYNSGEVVFEIENPPSRELAITQSIQQPLLLPYLVDLHLCKMEMVRNIWKCNWNKFLIPQKQPSESSFRNLTSIIVTECKSITYLFSPLMAKLLSNLGTIQIMFCDVIEELVSNKDDGDEEMVASMPTNTSNSFFPHLKSLILFHLPKLKRIGGGGGGGAKGRSNEISFNTTTTITPIHDQLKFSQVDVVSWSLCQYCRSIQIMGCDVLASVIPSYALGKMQKLERLEVDYCKSLVEVFETQEINKGDCCSTNIDEGSGGTNTALTITRLNDINVPQLTNLKILWITNCDLLKHVFTFSTLQSLMQLQELKIQKCKAMKVIVKEETTTSSSEVVVFPRLESIELLDLPNLVGFFLGTNEFQWPLLDDVRIDACPQMMVITYGRSIAQQLNYIQTSLGKHSLEIDHNFHVMTTLHQSPFSSLDNTRLCPTTSKFDNWIEMKVEFNDQIKKIFPSNGLLQLQKLEKIRLMYCGLVEEVFEALEGTDSSELQAVVKIPQLREMDLSYLKNLKYIWKNNPWMLLELPNLTKVSISYSSRLEHVFTSSMVGSLLQLQELHIYECQSLEHIFTSSMIGSLLQLQELHVVSCHNVDVIVKEENVEEEEEECDGEVNEIFTLPCLKSLKLTHLSRLKGFFLGNEAFSWPSLDTVEIFGCPSMTVFTKGHSTTPEMININYKRREVKEDINFFIKTKLKEEYQS